ncbi:uncharacterized protein LOC111238253 [Seriola dumerili]|uniref:uncharacterized protein LOC111238253 n=1 Tax=Seriola dumerili TaxID=41447 RepID=UPI000BBEBBA3|nr:uncharacterized protein LOC111238253 [Seriola dumerili]
MKLGLLMVLAVAVLVSSLSEGRIISKCELKEKLQAAIALPKYLHKHKEHILAIVICEVRKWSHLNTSLVKVEGERGATPTARPTTRATKLSTPLGDEMTTETTTSKPTTAKTTTRKPTTVKKTTSKPTTVKKTTSKPTTTEPETTEPSQTTLLSPSSRRRKREAGAMSNESISTDMVNNMDELLNEEESNFDEDELMQDDNKMTEEEERDGEDGEKGEVDEADVKQVPWSLGYYGLFQLSDSHFCDSGYRWSRNKCSTACTAFTDDDITDDIDCVVKTGYWRFLVISASHKCRRTLNFFSECK